MVSCESCVSDNWTVQRLQLNIKNLIFTFCARFTIFFFLRIGLIKITDTRYNIAELRWKCAPLWCPCRLSLFFPSCCYCLRQRLYCGAVSGCSMVVGQMRRRMRHWRKFKDAARGSGLYMADVELQTSHRILSCLVMLGLFSFWLLKHTRRPMR